MVDKKETWSRLTAALNEILDAVDLLEGIEMDEDQQQEQFNVIKNAAQTARSAVHEYIRPDLEEN